MKNVAHDSKEAPGLYFTVRTVVPSVRGLMHVFLARLLAISQHHRNLSLYNSLSLSLSLSLSGAEPQGCTRKERRQLLPGSPADCEGYVDSTRRRLETQNEQSNGEITKDQQFTKTEHIQCGCPKHVDTQRSAMDWIGMPTAG